MGMGSFDSACSLRSLRAAQDDNISFGLLKTNYGHNPELVVFAAPGS
jgi:hypothetical protein